jgi:hypothetical protein
MRRWGGRLDIDYVASEDYRVAQLTPPGSECSVIIGTGITSAAPGSLQGLQLIVVDIEAAHAELVGRGIDGSEVFHDESGLFHHAGTEGRVAGPDPKRSDYGSFASFSDPDGNGWRSKRCGCGRPVGDGTSIGKWPTDQCRINARPRALEE